MSNRFENDLSWLAELIAPVYSAMRESGVRREVLISQLAKEDEVFNRLCTQYGNLVKVANQHGVGASEIVERFGERSATQIEPQGRRLSNKELMLEIAGFIRESGRAVTLDEIMFFIEKVGIYMPGKSPRSNVQAYVSRSHLFKPIAKGVYALNQELLELGR